MARLKVETAGGRTGGIGFMILLTRPRKQKEEEMLLNQFWQEFKRNLQRNVEQHPQDYGTLLGESAEDYAFKTTVRLECAAAARGITTLQIGSQSFRQTFKAMWPQEKFSQRNFARRYKELE
jgi:hypothetical protein